MQYQVMVFYQYGVSFNLCLFAALQCLTSAGVFFEVNGENSSETSGDKFSRYAYLAINCEMQWFLFLKSFLGFMYAIFLKNKSC